MTVPPHLAAKQLLHQRITPARTAEITSVTPIHAAYRPAWITGPGGGLSGPIEFGYAFGKSLKKRTATKTSDASVSAWNAM